ncbi:hypothetical protein P8935_07235 [Telmatobacter sp. DSM 110680]|uniref:Uncharacterized protein n=1 Tax=Telmatobacter sp. DSM 110680 TaxID=3036704 RepID=A0AAU7DP55_9BACT
MRIWEVIGPNALKTQEVQIDHEEESLKNKRADLGIRKAQAAMAKAQKRKSEAAQKV